MNGGSQSNVANTPLAFFRAQHAAFAATLSDRRGGDVLIESLFSQAFDAFDGNLAIQVEEQPPVACHKGCASCCTLRVTATAPEVILIAKFIAKASAHFLSAGINLHDRVAKADATTRGLGEAERVEARCQCAFIAQGVCTIYPVRPFACRGHASHDKRACALAASGKAGDVPYSEAHRVVRSLVQNAMQSALRDAGYDWSLVELNHALGLALADPDGVERQWRAGVAVFAAARIPELDHDDMARTFDAIKTVQ